MAVESILVAINCESVNLLNGQINLSIKLTRVSLDNVLTMIIVLEDNGMIVQIVIVHQITFESDGNVGFLRGNKDVSFISDQVPGALLSIIRVGLHSNARLVYSIVCIFILVDLTTLDRGNLLERVAHLIASEHAGTLRLI